MLVDTSIWVDHLRQGNTTLALHLQRGEVLCHPFVIGELACGQLKNRGEILALLAALPGTPAATHDEALQFVESNQLAGAGIGWIDVHLLASAKLAGTVLWTRDKRLALLARRLGVGL
jgi:predicted nucleic acid-binding protein